MAAPRELVYMNRESIRNMNDTHMKIKDIDSILEELEGVDQEICIAALENLVDDGMIIKEIDEDEDRVYYRAKEGLEWTKVVHLDCPIKKKILLLLINNPKTFFVLYNTQKGKLRIAAEEICSWAELTTQKVVSFLIVDNDKTLADQSADGMNEILDGKAEILVLSSNKPDVSYDSIRKTIDAYAADSDGEYRMPLVVALNNKVQLDKVEKLMMHIKNKVEKRNSLLRYGIVFDEADKVYPPLRSKFLPLLVDDTRALHRLGFVTATEGDLMNSDFPECANADMYEVPEESPDYRAMHTIDAKIEIVPWGLKETNDSYAEKIISNNQQYFTTPIVLKDGSLGFRKTIVNGAAKTASMDLFARNRVKEGYYAMTVNMFGVTVYRPGYDTVRFPTKDKRFGQLLHSIYVDLGLHDRPLFIIGRRKVDRGVSFHWAPRDGSAGLIWSDVILGRVLDKYMASQKAGRLAGKVASNSQYPLHLTWWTDKKTAESVITHNKKVDKTNTIRGYSAAESLARAEATVPEVDANLYRIYKEEADTRAVCALLGYQYIPTKNNEYGFKETSLNKSTSVVSLQDAIRKVPTAYGTNNGVRTYRTYYPCYVNITDNTSLRFVVIIRPGTDKNKLAECDAKFTSIRL